MCISLEYLFVKIRTVKVIVIFLDLICARQALNSQEIGGQNMDSEDIWLN